MTDNDKKNINTMQDSQLPRTRRNWPSIKGTDKDRASRGLSRLEDITRLISEMVWEIDSEGKISYISDRLFETLGFLPVQIIGMSFSELGTFYSVSGETVDINWKNPFRDVMFKTVDNRDEERTLLISGVPYYAPDTWDYEGISGTARDITDQLAAEKNLKGALKKAEWANKAKTEFLSTISHELRTPLTSIKGSVDLIQGMMAKDLPNDVLDLLEITNRNSNTLLTLINEMLDYEKVLSGLMVIELSAHDVTALVKDEINLTQNYSSTLGVNVELSIDESDDLIALVNEQRLGQVIRNLLSNATKFSHKDGTVEISIERKNDNICINVKDYGFGIRDEDKTKIFERYIQTDTSKKSQNIGTGLGLSISKALTQTMGGTISFTSELDVGSTFTVKFPAANEANVPN